MGCEFLRLEAVWNVVQILYYLLSLDLVNGYICELTTVLLEYWHKGECCVEVVRFGKLWRVNVKIHGLAETSLFWTLYLTVQPFCVSYDLTGLSTELDCFVKRYKYAAHKLHLTKKTMWMLSNHSFSHVTCMNNLKSTSVKEVKTFFTAESDCYLHVLHLYKDSLCYLA